jgi:hypothetical protein
MASSGPCLVSMLLEVSGPLLESVVTCANTTGIPLTLVGQINSRRPLQKPTGIK